MSYKITTIALGDPAYPRLLAEINDPPQTLFVRGHLPPPELPLVAIVGTRRASLYGKQVTQEFSQRLASAGVGIVSGLALGIDGIAHEATLMGGYTVAVLGSGVDEHTVYPQSHRGLAERILASGGALISEYPEGFRPTAYSFPARNRIIAGLTLGTLVTEAPSESGALITAHYALDYNREVFVVPHPITSPTGQGCNNLISLGALLVSQPNDILSALRLSSPPAATIATAGLSAEETCLLILLTKEPRHIDDLVKCSGLSEQTVSSTLSLLELSGKIRALDGLHYVLVS